MTVGYGSPCTLYNFLEDVPEEAPSNFEGKDTTPALKSLYRHEESYRILPHPREWITPFQSQHQRGANTRRSTEVELVGVDDDVQLD